MDWDILRELLIILLSETKGKETLAFYYEPGFKVFDYAECSILHKRQCELMGSQLRIVLLVVQVRALVWTVVVAFETYIAQNKTLKPSSTFYRLYS